MLPVDVESLIEYASTNDVEYIHFVGHQPSKDGSITKSCFSQWWDSEFTDEMGLYYKTAEQFMMLQKAKLFGDEVSLEKILKSTTPIEAKELGRKVKGFDPESWDRCKFNIVVHGNMLKFSQNESLKEFLLSTGDKILVEAAHYDPVWGIGMRANHVNACIPEKWAGENLLGFALMEVREQLKT